MGGFRCLRSFIASARFPSKCPGSALGDQRGTASLEFASTLPLLILILLGTIDFGRFAYAAIAVTNAARTGAAFCNYVTVASSCANTQAIKDEVTAAAAPHVMILNSEIGVTLPVCTAASDPCILRVQVTHPFSTSMSIPQLTAGAGWVWNKVDLIIVRSAEMRVGLN